MSAVHDAVLPEDSFDRPRVVFRCAKCATRQPGRTAPPIAVAALWQKTGHWEIYEATLEWSHAVAAKQEHDGAKAELQRAYEIPLRPGERRGRRMRPGYDNAVEKLEKRGIADYLRNDETRATARAMERQNYTLFKVARLNESSRVRTLQMHCCKCGAKPRAKLERLCGLAARAREFERGEVFV